MCSFGYLQTLSQLITLCFIVWLIRWCSWLKKLQDRERKTTNRPTTAQRDGLDSSVERMRRFLPTKPHHWPLKISQIVSTDDWSVKKQQAYLPKVADDCHIPEVTALNMDPARGWVFCTPPNGCCDSHIIVHFMKEPGIRLIFANCAHKSSLFYWNLMWALLKVI